MSIEEIKVRMLADISADYDKTQGGFMYDAVAPVAIEMQKSYDNQDVILKNAFASTASGEYLDRKCSELGITRKPSAPSTGSVTITGTVGATINKGAYVATELANYAATETVTIDSTGKATVNVQCTQNGSIGNVAANTIKYFPITLEGINAVTNEAPFTNGYDAESDSSLYERYYSKVNTPATSGNSAHYEQWAKSVTGVGGAKIFPTWNGPGTVKVVICNSNKRAADQQLITNTAAYIETQRPVGATVTVASATEKNISITANIILGNGVTIETVKTAFEKAITEYFKELTFKSSYISYAKVGSILYDIYGVADYSDLKINTGITNIALADTELPVIGTVVLTSAT